VGTIASGGDEDTGRMLAEAMQRVGKDGVITVEEGKGLETRVEWVEGMQFDRGYLSPYFVTDPAEMKAVFKDCYLLIHEKKISAAKDLIPLLELVMKSGKPLVIIADDINAMICDLSEKAGNRESRAVYRHSRNRPKAMVETWRRSVWGLTELGSNSPWVMALSTYTS